LTEYFTELTQAPVRESFARMCGPTHLIFERVFAERWPAGICGAIYFGCDTRRQFTVFTDPAFELYENRPIPRAARVSEIQKKYEVRVWDTNNPNSLRDLITRINAIRKAAPRCNGDWSLRFHPVDNETLIAYSRFRRSANKIIGGGQTLTRTMCIRVAFRGR